MRSGRATLALLIVLAAAYPVAARQNEAQHVFEQAVEAQQRGDYAQAVTDYRQVLRLAPDSAETRMNLGAALVKLGRLEEAISEYRAAAKLAPVNPQIQFDLALAYYKESKWEEAAGVFEALQKSDPGNPRLATLLGDCDLRLGRHQAALEATQAAADAHADDADLAYVRGSALIRSGQKAQGAALIEHVARQTNSAPAYALAGSTRLDVNDTEQAMRDFDAARALDPQLKGLHTLAGMAHDKMSDMAGAEKELRLAVAADPHDFQANLYLGAVLYKEHELEQAKPFLEKALQLEPVSLLARYEMALVKGGSGRIGEAVADLEAVERQDPSWLEPHVALASLYYKQHRAADGAKEREVVDKLTAEQQDKEPQ